MQVFNLHLTCIYTSYFFIATLKRRFPYPDKMVLCIHFRGVKVQLFIYFFIKYNDQQKALTLFSLMHVDYMSI